MSTVSSPDKNHSSSPVRDASPDYAHQAGSKSDATLKCDSSHPGVRHNMHTGHYGQCVFSVKPEVLLSCLKSSCFAADKCKSCKKWNAGHRKKCIRFIRNLEKHQGIHGLPRKNHRNKSQLLFSSFKLPPRPFT